MQQVTSIVCLQGYWYDDVHPPVANMAVPAADLPGGLLGRHLPLPCLYHQVGLPDHQLLSPRPQQHVQLQD